MCEPRLLFASPTFTSHTLETHFVIIDGTLTLREDYLLRWSLFYGTERNGTEQFRHIIPRNGTIDACTLRSNQTIQTEIDVYFLFGSYHW